MLGEQYQTFAVALVVIEWRTRAVRFFRCVENFEREDGEAVDHQARGFGMERG